MEKNNNCITCGKSFSLKHHARRHEKVCNGTKDIKLFSCDVCHTEFKSKRTLKYHKNKCTSGQKKYCKKCSETFNTEKQLFYHKQDHDKFFCDLCEDFRGHSKHMKRHMKTVHKGFTPSINAKWLEKLSKKKIIFV